MLPPTPLYNLAILEDMAVMLHHRLLVKALGSSAVLQQTVLLLKVCRSIPILILTEYTHTISVIAWHGCAGVADPARHALLR